MALVSFLPPVKEPIPHEPGQWIEFRKPHNGVVRDARKVVESEGRRALGDFGPEIVKAFTSSGDDKKAVDRIRQLEQAAQYDPSQFDRLTILKHAIVDWSYVDPKTSEKIPVSHDQIENNLDEPTAEWAHRFVVKQLAPPSTDDIKSAAPTGAPGA